MKEAKKAMSEAKFNAQESLNKKMDTKEGDIYIYINQLRQEKRRPGSQFEVWKCEGKMGLYS